MAKHFKKIELCFKILDRTNFWEGQFLFIYLFLLTKFVENVTKIKKSSDSGQNETSLGENYV